MTKHRSSLIEADACSSSDVVLDGHRVTVTRIDSDLLPGVEPQRIHGIGVVVFAGDDEMVVMQIARDVEVPAETVGDTILNMEGAARCEAWEQDRLIMGDLHLAQLVRVDWRDRTAAPVYLPIYAGVVDSAHPFEDSTLFVTYQEYVDVVGFGTKANRQQLITDAKAAIAETAQPQFTR
ncbi:hypothetical protein AB0E59_42430 [Lentzea sp. NPDC034063]|uniref:hypothetical protein n=1 Tax=unclassified Lentzea TaxID=2643253 RepID=UPI0033F38208